MNQRWILASPDPVATDSLARALQIPRAIAGILVARGYRDAEAARQFLAPQLRQLRDPFELPDMKPATDRVLAAIAGQQRIVIYGDYDVDGVTSSALLTRVLRAAGATVANFLPHRMDEGYGLSADGIARCVKDHRPRLLVGVDCGTSSAAEIAGLKAEGVDVIVLDHHEPPAKLPECVALVNPKRSNASTLQRSHDPFASVGVAFKLAHALLKQDRRLSIDLREHLDLVALGTVADLVPLTGENRILVKAGLDRLPATKKTGLRALMDVADVAGSVTPYHIGFRLGPRLNAAGRLADAMAALELLLTEEAGRAGELAAMLDAHNADRQRLEGRITEEALAQAEKCRHDRVLVLADEAWHPGVIGIVASRVMQEFYRPVVVIGAEGKGSCRSVPGFSMVEALRCCASVLEKFGGHEMAAGLTIRSGQLAELRRQLNALAAELPERTVPVDAEVALGELDEKFFAALDRLEPCGVGNPTPVFVARGVRLRGRSRVVGKNHLKFSVTDGATTVEAIWWGKAGEALPSGVFDVAFTAEVNAYRGVETVQLKVRDVRAA